MEGTISKIEGVVRMEIRPTGLLDPEVVVRPTKGQVQNLMSEINNRVEKDERVLVTVMTIKFAEEVAEYLDRNGIKAHYLHSEIDTLERTEIIKALRLGHIDVIVGINLLREGLDIPEVSLVAIFDADKQGFLRNERSLLQTIGRASRNQNGNVILYADSISPAMEAAMSQTISRRGRQNLHNQKHDIVPRTIQKALPTMGQEVGSLLAGTAGKGAKGGKRFVGKFRSKKGVSGLAQKFSLGAGMWNTSNSVLENISQPEFEIDHGESSDIPENIENEKIVSKLEREMRTAAERLDFERAAEIRDRIIQLRNPSN
jgi:excinuclease ABC subunit B